MATRHLKPFDEATAKHVADIIGPSSGAAKALRELHERRAAGEQVALYRDARDSHTLWVGPDHRAALATHPQED